MRQGYSSVTMTDIIEETGISRGGIYLYFRSVDEIFAQVIRDYDAERLEAIRTAVKQGGEFSLLLDTFFDNRKNALLQREHSLRRAMYEFFLCHGQDACQHHYAEQLKNKTAILTEILRCGCIHGDVPEQLSSTVALALEGMGTVTLMQDVDPDTLDRQLAYLKQLIVCELAERNGVLRL